MKAHNPNFITFAGDALGGRVPARLTVHGGGGKITEPQMESVDRLYRTFCMANNLSLAWHTTRNYAFGDGMKVRMVSIQGVDEVHVELPVAPRITSERLPHGFAVKDDWLTPFIYARKLPEMTWSRAPDEVPQVEETVESANQLLWEIGAAILIRPQVVAPPAIWDYIKNDLAAEITTLTGAATTVIPMRLQRPDVTNPAKYVESDQLYALDDKIYDDEGVLRHTAAASAAISTSDPETPKYLPVVTSADGSRAILTHTRQFAISPTYNIWEWRAKAEAVKMTGRNTFEVTTTVSNTVILPLAVVTPSSASTDTLGEDLRGKIFLYVYDPHGGAGSTDGVTHASMGFGYKRVSDDDGLDPFSGYAPYEAEDAFHETILPGANSPTVATIGPMLLLPENAAPRPLEISANLSYIRTMDWRGGIKQRYMDTQLFEFLPPHVGLWFLLRQRCDSNMAMAGTPLVTASLGWATFEIFSGSTSGVMEGTYYRDTEQTLHTPSFREFCEITENGLWELVTYSPTTGEAMEDLALAAATNVMGQNMAQFITPFPNATTYKVLTDSPPENRGGYALTSRHIIDYDHKGRFYVALKVTVACAGALWVEARGTYPGCMVLGANPGYDVLIEVETKWDGTATATQTVYHGTHTRPAFEFITYEMTNPFRWPDAINGPLYPTHVRMPPNVSLPVEAMRQLNVIGTDQSSNTNIAVEDAEGTDPSASHAGVEYSTIHSDGRVSPVVRFATGQLYARTFALGDLSDALWLLRHTKCDVSEDGQTGSSWFYMAGFAEFLSQKHHIEIRDGAFNTWTDNIPAKDGETRPAPVDRDIKLYRV